MRVRFDFLEKDGQIYLNEINTVPGSMSYYFFADSPKEAGGFFRDLIKEGIAFYREEESKIKCYASPVLSALGGNKCKSKKR